MPITVRIVNIDTNAYIGNGAAVNAENDVSVTANGQEQVIGVTAGAGGGMVGVAGTVSVTVLNVHTYACTGTPTSPDYKCATGGATINADNNVLVSATDTSQARAGHGRGGRRLRRRRPRGRRRRDPQGDRGVPRRAAAS